MGIKVQYNPSTGKVHFTAATKKVQVVDTGGGFATDDCCCFLEPETPGACGNTEWNSYPPYGGVGKTPKEYAVTVTDIPAISGFSGVLIPSKVNGTHILQTVPVFTAFFCNWQIAIPDATDEGDTLFIEVNMIDGQFGSAEVRIYASPPIQLGNIYSQIFMDDCTISGSEILTYLGDDYTIEWNPN